MVATVQPTSATEETTRLISSEKVTGSKVENTKGDNLGHIEEIMIDKICGRVGYAVLNYGSFLGMGGKLFALPWEILKYDTRRRRLHYRHSGRAAEERAELRQRHLAGYGRSRLGQVDPRLLRLTADWYL